MALLEIFLVLVGYTEDNDDGSKGDIMKNRGRSPASHSGGARAKDTLRSGTGSSGRSVASDHEHEENPNVSTHPSGGTIALAAMTSTLAAATAEENLSLPAGAASANVSSSSVSPSHHVRHVSDADSSSLGNSIFYDDPDVLAQLSGSPADPALTQKAIEHYQAKISKTKELIKDVQTSLDTNVNEYLKLSANAADATQQQRIKQVFEKKNQKSAQQIAQLQRKLDDYKRKVSDLEKHGLPKAKIRDISQGLKHVGGNIRDGISGMSSTVMSKPKEFASIFLRGHNRYGSADNLSSSTMPAGESKSDTTGSNTRSTTLPNDKAGKPNSSSFPRDSSAQSSFEERRKCLSEDGGLRNHRSTHASEVSEDSSVHHGAAGTGTKSASSSHGIQAQIATNDSSGTNANSPLRGGNPSVGNHRSGAGQHNMINDDVAMSEWNTIVTELTLHKEEVDRLREEMDDLRQQCKADVETLTDRLLEERESYARLEEQINDLTELHQHEIENIKSGITDMEEKVQYQSEERLLDIKEHLQSLETKVTSMEHQQVQQQYLNIEGLDSSDARAIMMKLLNALITFVHVILFFIGTFMSLAKPFFRTTPRLLSTAILVLLSMAAYHQQETLAVLFLKLRQSKKS